MENPCAFLSWAATGGLSIVAGTLLSLLVDVWPGYDKLPPKLKRLVFFGLAIVVGGGALGLSYIPILGCASVGWWAVVQAVYNAFLAFGSGTIAHTRKL